MSQQHSDEEIESRMRKVLEGFREVLAENGFAGLDMFQIELRDTVTMKTLFTSKDGCTWEYVCKPTPYGVECRWECV